MNYDLNLFKDLEKFKDDISARYFKNFQDYCLERIKDNNYLTANIIEEFIQDKILSPYDSDNMSQLRYIFGHEDADVGVAMYKTMIDFFKLYQSENATAYDFTEKEVLPEFITKEALMICFDCGNIFPRYVNQIEEDIEKK